MPGMLEEQQQGGLCGWSRVGEGEGREGVGVGCAGP